MNRQSGAATIAIAVLALGIAGGAYFGWREHQQLAKVRGDLAALQSDFEKTSAEARKAKADAVALRKDLDEQKMAADQMRADRDAARAMLDGEKARGERLQTELTLTRAQLAFMKSRQSQALQHAPAMPVLVRPTIIRAAPAQGRAVGAASPASPIQGASPAGQGYFPNK